jgi:nucleotide-binding universal stress UspA family protein
MNGQVRGIVVGYDGSAGAQVALDWAAETARREDRSLTVLHCVDLAMVPGFPAYDPVQLEPSLEEASRTVLEEGARRAAKVLPESRVSSFHAIGSPAAELVEASKEADLVVTGCRGRGRVLGGLLGSTSYAVTAHAECPAVVVRAPEGEGVEETPVPPPPGPDRRVIVGLDDSDASERALELAAGIADTAKAPLHIVRVAKPVSMEAWTYVETAKGGTEETHALREHAGATVARAAAHVAATHPDVAVETEVLYGDPGHVLADLAEDAGLVVVGSRGRGGFTGLLLGSVSHTVIHQASCPVMVVR